MPHVFISYSREDKATMRRIKRTLIESGLEVWTDEGIEEGTPNWQLAIEKAIEEAECLICILTPTSKRSSWVREELMYATLYEKQIYMLHAEGDYKRVAILGFTVVQLIDLRDNDFYDMQMAKLANHIHDKSRVYDDSNVTRQFQIPPKPKATSEPVVSQPQSQIEEIINKFMPMSIPEGERHVFIVNKGGEYTSRTVYTITDTFVTIGREKHNAIHVDDNSVSREHSQLIYTNDGFLVRDLGSTNGTFVNTERVSIRNLKTGDTIQVGLNFALLYKIIRVTDAYDNSETQVAMVAFSKADLEQGKEVLDNLKQLNQQTDQVKTVKMDDVQKRLENEENDLAD